MSYSLLTTVECARIETLGALNYSTWAIAEGTIPYDSV